MSEIAVLQKQKFPVKQMYHKFRISSRNIYARRYTDFRLRTSWSALFLQRNFYNKLVKLTRVKHFPPNYLADQFSFKYRMLHDLLHHFEQMHVIIFLCSVLLCATKRKYLNITKSMSKQLSFFVAYESLSNISFKYSLKILHLSK